MSSSLRRLTQSSTLQIIGVTALAFLVVAVSFATAYMEVDRLGADRQGETLLTALHQHGLSLRRELKGETIWGDAFVATAVKLDREWLDELYGSYLESLLGYQHIVVLRPDDRIGYAYRSDIADTPLAVADFADLVAALRTPGPTPAGITETATGVGELRHRAISDVRLIDGSPSMVVAQTILPDVAMNVSAALLARPPILVATLPLETSFIAGFGQQLDYAGLHWLQHSSVPGRDEAAVEVKTATGQSVGTLAWQTKPAGQTILARMTPGLAASALLLLGSVLLVIVNVRRQHGKLTRRARLEAAAARKDHLTGLANRFALTEELNRRLGGLPPHRLLALVLIDLDGFKHLNDSLGHLAGDAALVIVGERLRAAAPGHFAARTGGDEFALLMECDTADEIAFAADQVIEGLAVPYHSEKGGSIVLGCSIGYSQAPRHGLSYEELYRRADLALYAAKSDGRGRAFAFDENLEKKAVRRSALEVALRRAVQQNAIYLDYQPLLNEAGNEVIGVEALARWHDQELGQVSPGEFIPVAEETGLIVQLGEQILRRAIVEAGTWNGLPVSVNVSGQQLQHGELVETVSRLLEEHRFPPHLLEIELTESSLIADEAGADEQITRLQALGVKVSLDDFGTGYASLLYLRRFRFDKIKLDRSFIADSDHSDEARTLISRIAGLAHELGLTVTAEGVENAQQADFLQGAGCDRLQGFYFSRPLSARDLASFIEGRREAA